MNLARVLTEAAQARPDHPALLFEGKAWSYAALDRLASRFAHVLTSLGVGPDRVVAIFLESRPELLIAYLGAVKAGAVPNVVNGFLKAEEVRVIVADSEAQVLLTDPGRWAMLGSERAGLGVQSVLLTQEDVHTDRPEPGTLAFEALMAKADDAFDPVDRAPGDLASLLYTSGTTGLPKGVMLTQRNIADNAERFREVHYGPDDRVLIAAPLFHCWGLINGVLGIFGARGTAIIVRRFQTEPVLDLIESARPTIMLGVPVMYNFMAKSPTFRERDLGSLRFVLSAAAPTPVELIEVLAREWKVGYAESYGLTETSPVITTTHHSQNRPGSCGRAMGDTELKVTGHAGETLPAGSVGELWARGTAIAAGYFRRPEATAEVFTPDGWFKTGDIVRIDADGYVYIVDRLKDMINVAGEKVYPRDVEEVLYRHPAVADAVVLGVPDADRGEVVKALVALKPGCTWTADEVIAYLKPALAAYKLPRHVEFVESVPRSPSGKALRRLLR